MKLLLLFYLCSLQMLQGQVPYFNVQFDYSHKLEAAMRGSIETDSFYIFPVKGGSPYQNIADTSFLLKINKYNQEINYFKVSYFIGQSVTSISKKTSDELIIQGSNYKAPKEYANADNNQYFAVLNKNTLDTILMREYGFPDRSDVFYRHILTSDGGIFSSGWSFGLQPNDRQSLLVFKCDSNLNQQFIKLYSVSQVNNHFGAEVVETPDKGFIIIGTRQVGNPPDFSNALVIKVDSAGNLVFWKEIEHNGDTTELYLTGITKSGVTNYIAVGRRIFNPQVGPGWERSWVVGIDGQGNVLWSKAYAENERSGWSSITPSHDGNFYACGYERDFADAIYKQYATISKLSPLGDLIWHRKYSVEPTGKHYDIFLNVLTTSDGGILCNGTTYGNDTTLQNAWVIKLDSFGCATPGCQTGVGVQALPVGKATPFTLWPNPTAGEFTIETKDGYVLEAIRITSSDGREVVNHPDPGGSTRYAASISDQPGGWYLCSVLVNGVWYVRQFILIK